MYSFVPSHRMSDREFARVSMSADVRVQACVVGFWRQMAKRDVAVSHMLDHQYPSLNQSLDSGLDPLGEPEAPW